MRRLLSVVAFGALGLSGCTPDFITRDSSSMFMEISSIAPVSGSGEIRSDVISDDGGIFNDDATVTVNVFRKNPTVSSTSPLEHVTLDSYSVRYFRSDGHNAEGVDVPFAISGPLGSVRFHTQTDTSEQEIDVPVTIVRHAAKEEPPLRQLRNGGGLDLITCIAEITIFARQIDGSTMQATGRVQVTFADFAG